MKIIVPQDQIDTLMTREDFIKRVEECVNSENLRLVGITLFNITNINAKAGSHILQALALLKPIALENPELAAKINRELVAASDTLKQLTQHFEIEKAMGEKLHETQH
ncbi:hypothetical protein KNV09_gp153 [Vibrio phage Athena]|uniref:Uncharacterized protein n=4 Tax=Thalassavirus TaxID=2948922 RepID=A0A6M4ESC4_9CAUD|nr:hypothetical protein KNU52_gp137 [Vibrio phage Achelous]YP_010105731.1 hypothetical protein KNU87_gp148 [Vibrio phage Bennett]YP_010105922.1 hypothetical protein KNU88_gp150 [Vibrio phage Chester]YP_010108757.1 hypothetical protein KNV09_gp153 [Vibrio phage Athena]QIG66257.1 hypothetical protein CILSICK_158 [Vibrio phage Cilsick]QIG66450.1 hypothetical protein CHAZLY21_159 [Vibrio phage Chazly21]QKE60998.1 hypothetical protein DAX_161 [Vibrio phage Dax]QKN84607.1 hypothetical protein BBMU